MKRVGAISAASALVGLCCPLLCLPVAAAQQSASPPSPRTAPRHALSPDPGPQPKERIDVASLGYAPPGAFYLTYRLTSASLSFIDDDHLLFTFRVGGLLHRIPGDPADDDDQQIRAVVLDVATGKTLHQAEWRMHDRSQYLWPLADGKFLVRIRDSLFMTDESLVLHPWLSFDSALRSVQVSTDRQIVVVQRDDPPKLANPTIEPDGPPAKLPVKVELIAVGGKTAKIFHEGDSAVRIPLVADGVLDVLEGSQLSSWAIRDVPWDGKPRILAQVKSGCQPTLQTVSENVALAMGCYQGADDRPVVALTIDGHELWRDQWQNKFVWGWFTSAQNGSRFAYESLQVVRPISVFDELDEDDISGQFVGVYDTESGKLVLVKNVSPVLTAGQNAALSNDGKFFAVLRNGAIEVYELPPVSPRPPDKQERAATVARPGKGR